MAKVIIKQIKSGIDRPAVQEDIEGVGSSSIEPLRGERGYTTNHGHDSHRESPR